MRSLAFALAFAATAGSAFAQDTKSSSSLMPVSIDNNNGKAIKAGTTIIIPTTVAYISIDGSLFVVNQKKGTAQAKAEFSVAGLDKAYLQELAGKVQADLVSRLKSAGFTVQLNDEIKGHAEMAGKEMLKVDEDFGMPTKDQNKVNFAIATPNDAQTYKPPMQGYAYGFRKLAKETGSIVMIPEYVFNAPQMWGEKGHSSAKVNMAPGMNLTWATINFINGKQAIGQFLLKDQLINTSEKVGELALLDQDKSSFGGALGGFGAGRIKKNKGSYELVVDKAAFEAGVMRGAMSYHEAVIAQIKGELAK